MGTETGKKRKRGKAKAQISQNKKFKSGEFQNESLDVMVKQEYCPDEDVIKSEELKETKNRRPESPSDDTSPIQGRRSGQRYNHDCFIGVLRQQKVVLRLLPGRIWEVEGIPRSHKGNARGKALQM